MPITTESHACNRCGTCCRKGGPALHQEDRRLVEDGHIHTRQLVTLRAGETTRDPIEGRLVTLAGEVIKIKGRGGTWCCRFFAPQRQACRIYAFRPLECRLLTCWDTQAIESGYTRDRLTRRDLLSGIRGLWELVEAHEQRCGYERIQRLCAGREGCSASGARRALEELIAYDAELRRLVVARGGLEHGMTDFLFGRPLRKTLPNLLKRPPSPER
jgi:Fe-S-cluster containining protein